MEVKTLFNLTRNFSGDVVYITAINDSLSSVVLSSDLTKNLQPSQYFDVVVGSYPTIVPLLPPSLSNFTIVSVILTVQLWSEGVSKNNLPAPMIITLPHLRKVRLVWRLSMIICQVSLVYMSYRCMCMTRRVLSVCPGRAVDQCMSYNHTVYSCRRIYLFVRHCLHTSDPSLSATGLSSLYFSFTVKYRGPVVLDSAVTHTVRMC